MISAMTFDFDIVNFPFLDGDVPRSTSYGVNISQLIRFARVSSRVVDFNARNKSLTAKLLQQGYRYHKLFTLQCPPVLIIYREKKQMVEGVIGIVSSFVYEVAEKPTFLQLC